MRKITLALCTTMLMSGCDAVDNPFASNDPHQIGRFLPIPRSGNDAQLILDTANGCAFEAGAVTSIDTNSAKPKSCEAAMAKRLHYNPETGELEPASRPPVHSADIEAILKKYGVDRELTPDRSKDEAPK